MNRIKQYINIMFWGCWISYLLLFMSFCSYNYIKYETLPPVYKSLYALWGGLLLCSFLGRIRLKYFRSLIFLAFIFFMIANVFNYSEQNFIHNVEDCYETQDCNILIGDSQ